MYLYYQNQFESKPKASRCYDLFKVYLEESGFTVYPTEFDCLYSKHPLVDIAAKMGSFYWAFEYKSETDSVSRGVEQLECYLEWFDYVVLVSERIFDHRYSTNYWSLKNIGAGLWFYDPVQDKCVKKSNPLVQKPDVNNHRMVVRRFSAMSVANSALKETRQFGSESRRPRCSSGQSVLSPFLSSNT